MYKEYVGRIVNNASEFKFRRNFAFACSPSLSPGVITRLEHAIQWKTHCLVSGQLSCQLIITWTYGNGATLLFFKVRDLAYGRTYVRTDSHVTTKILEIDELKNSLRYGALLMRLQCAGAPLLIRCRSTIPVYVISRNIVSPQKPATIAIISHFHVISAVSGRNRSIVSVIVVVDGVLIVILNSADDLVVGQGCENCRL